MFVALHVCSPQQRQPRRAEGDGGRSFPAFICRERLIIQTFSLGEKTPHLRRCPAPCVVWLGKGLEEHPVLLSCTLGCWDSSGDSVPQRITPRSCRGDAEAGSESTRAVYPPSQCPRGVSGTIPCGSCSLCCVPAPGCAVRSQSPPAPRDCVPPPAAALQEQVEGSGEPKPPEN